jgi:hypothetical protein
MRQKDLCRLRLVAAANINQIMIWYFNSVFEEDPVVIKEMPIRGQLSQHHSYLLSFLKCCMIHYCGKRADVRLLTSSQGQSASYVSWP